jgi:hypothetical protein
MKLDSAKDSSLLLSLDDLQLGARAVFAKFRHEKIAQQSQLADGKVFKTWFDDQPDTVSAIGQLLGESIDGPEPVV